MYSECYLLSHIQGNHIIKSYYYYCVPLLGHEGNHAPPLRHAAIWPKLLLGQNVSVDVKRIGSRMIHKPSAWNCVGFPNPLREQMIHLGEEDKSFG